MKIIFIGSTGIHHTLIAAQIYLGRLHKNDFRLIKHLFDASKDRSGNPIYIGKDGAGTEVYTLGAGKHYKMMASIVEQLRDLLKCPASDLMVCPVSIWGEYLLTVLENLPGESYISPLLARFLMGGQFDRIHQEVDRIKVQVSQTKARAPGGDLKQATLH